jgi:hypothetical protein
LNEKKITITTAGGKITTLLVPLPPTKEQWKKMNEY